MPTRTAAKFTLAHPEDADAIASLRNAVADHLSICHGRGWWSRHVTRQGVRFEMRISTVYVLRTRNEIVATFRLATRKPWAIDPTYFTPVERVLYLHSVAVLPARQRRGVGTRCLAAAVKLAREWPADAIRVDAFDHAAGAGEFYRRCGFREVGRLTYRKTPLVYFEQLL